MAQTSALTSAATDGALPELHLRADGEEALAEGVYRELREAICDTRLAPSQRLVQNTLADHLGISRTPVRDALLRLAQEGLVRALPWRGGFMVSEFTAREVLDIYDVRLPLELLAARDAVGRHTGAQLAELRDINSRLGGMGDDDLSAQYRLNHRLHAGIVEPCKNAVLKRMLDQLWSMPSSLRMYHQQVRARDAVAVMAAEHAGILDALDAADATRTAARVREHIEGAKRDALAHFESLRD